MKQTTRAFLLIGGLALSACANVETATGRAPFEAQAPMTETVSRAAIAPEALPAAAPADAVSQPKLRIESYSVTVPHELRVSEANVFYPLGDIVWRGDPLGDRHQQVAAIFETSLQKSAGLMTQGRPARVEIEVKRFHSVTEKTRYTTGGMHSITFQIAAFDPQTGAPLMKPHVVSADLNAYGGARAIEAERKGHTQKFRVTNHLVKTLYREITGELPTTVAASAVQAAAEGPVRAEGRIALN